MRRHPGAAVADPDRFLPCGALGTEVGGPDRRAGRGETGALGGREVALVKVVEAGEGETLEGPGESRLADELAGSPAPAGRTVDRRPRLAPVREILAGGEVAGRRLDRLDVSIPGREAADGELDRRAEDRVAPEPAIAP